MHQYSLLFSVTPTDSHQLCMKLGGKKRQKGAAFSSKVSRTYEKTIVKINIVSNKIICSFPGGYDSCISRKDAV